MTAKGVGEAAIQEAPGLGYSDDNLLVAVVIRRMHRL